MLHKYRINTIIISTCKTTEKRDVSWKAQYDSDPNTFRMSYRPKLMH